MTFQNDKLWFTVVISNYLYFTYNKPSGCACWRMGPFAYFRAGATGKIVRLTSLNGGPKEQAWPNPARFTK